MKRRDFFKKLGIGVGVAVAAPAVLTQVKEEKKPDWVLLDEQGTYPNIDWPKENGRLRYVDPKYTLTPDCYCPEGLSPSEEMEWRFKFALDREMFLGEIK